MSVKSIMRAAENLNIAVREAVTSAKSALHTRVWKIPETSNKLFQRALSHEQLPKTGSNIPKLFTAVLGGGVLMTQRIKLEDFEVVLSADSEELAKSAMQVLDNGPLRPMSDTSAELETAILNYLKEKIHSAMTDPSTFALGCEIEVSSESVLPYLSHKELADEIPTSFKIIVPVETLAFLKNNEFSALHLILRDKHKEPFQPEKYQERLWTVAF
ncbi:MAG TPA: hypothetical protein VLG76_06350 [Rhabdochlamydiaceae bacterium]|nr:hypothetical protein [Rhabdochlamydiaceae bacterium]